MADTFKILMLPLYFSKLRELFSKNIFWIAVLGISIITGGAYFSQTNHSPNIAEKENITGKDVVLSNWVDENPVFDENEKNIPQIEGEDALPILPPPPPPSMERMKKQGCVADGFLSGYGGDINSSIALVNRSQCYYLHRSLETWLKPPDFKLARKIINKVTKPNTVYGMFIAEAIETKSNYFYPAENRDFDFGEMCAPGSKNYWGEHTCRPSLARAEYRKYVQYIAEQAMDLGIQSFLFGQVFYQDGNDNPKEIMSAIIRDMREYADFRGMKIIIGAQTNDITDENYLRLFDYIEGGVGLQSDGSIEDGPCFSRWWKNPGDWCWALLWHNNFASKANNVFVHFDWSGKMGDDMSVFTRMDKDKREETLRHLHNYFTNRDIGFLMPMLATLSKDNGGCNGPKKRFYSASRKYSCADEDAINQIISSQK